MVHAFKIVKPKNKIVEDYLYRELNKRMEGSISKYLGSADFWEIYPLYFNYTYGACLLPTPTYWEMEETSYEKLSKDPIKYMDFVEDQDEINELIEEWNKGF